ncbi:MAG: lytic transglycosylase [Saprospiraceae bacterium]|nr:MAG: lytic transglycosylase [Saprospiraceae bacterium]
MKLPWTLSAVMVATHLLAAASNANKLTSNLNETPSLLADDRIVPTDEVIKKRLSKIYLPFEAKYTKEVKTYIHRYVTAGINDAEAMLGRSSLYFPIFEHYLNIYGLPQELKFLPMVESTLRPDVNSGAGAVGLWQFVPITARHFNLTINDYIDERMDPYKSTEAAVKMLSYLYDQFGDWPLALAAYNCGPKRIKTILAKAHCKNYWDIASLLPTETQRYVPAYIAAAYLVNHFNDHDLSPKYPSYELQDTRTFKVYQTVRFSDIARACGIKTSVIRKLNPGFIRQFIPAQSEGHYLILPSRAESSFRDYMAERFKIKSAQPVIDDLRNIFRTSYTVIPGDKIESLAILFRCSVEDIMEWNQLRQQEVVVNQSLVLYLNRLNGKAKP